MDSPLTQADDADQSGPDQLGANHPAADQVGTDQSEPSQPGVDRSKHEAPAAEVEAVVGGFHDNPFAVLGLHERDGLFVARAFVPHAESLSAFTLSDEPAGELTRRHDAGFFEGVVAINERQPLKYLARNTGGEWWSVDAYTFGPVLGPTDDYLIAEGSHQRLFDKMGAHLIRHEGAEGVHFAVWAPNARRVSVVGDWNNWDGRVHAMRLRRDVGVWEIFVPTLSDSRSYKFELIGQGGERLPLKSDPFAFRTELRPARPCCAKTLGGPRPATRGAKGAW